jgi:hypothetical protein
LTNDGTIALSAGVSDVFGDVTQSSSGKTIVTGSAVASLYDAVTNDAGSEFRVSSNSTAVFFGTVSGTSAFTGSGTVIFEGTSSLGAINRSGTTVVEDNGALSVQHVRENRLIVNGPVTIVPDGASAGTSRVQALYIEGGSTPTARLDLNNNDLVIDYAAPSPVAIVRAQIRSAYNGGSWSGNGIATSTGDLSNNFALGFAEASEIFTSFPATFSGQQVDDTSLLIAFTRYGDANLDSVVNLADFNRLAINFGQSNRFWHHGDFNYDGVVNLADFNRLAINFGLSAAGPEVTPQDWANLAAAVPEPAAVSLLLSTAAALCITRRRRVT